MRKTIIFITFFVMCIIANTPHGLAANISFDFEQFISSEDGKTYPDGWYCQNATSDDNTGLFAVPTERGISVKMVSVESSYYQMRCDIKQTVPLPFKLEASVMFEDKNVDRSLGLRYSNKTIYEWAKFHKDGKVTTFGTDTGLTYETGKWYDVSVVVEPNVGYETVISDGKNVYSFSGSFNNEFPSLDSIYFTNGGITDTYSAAYIDDIKISGAPGLGSAFGYSYNFDSFISSDDGQSLPAGLSAQNIAHGKTSFEAVDGSLRVYNNGEMYTEIMQNFGKDICEELTAKCDIYISDTNLESRNFGFRAPYGTGSPGITWVVKFMGADRSIRIGGDGEEYIAGYYETGKWYNVEISADLPQYPYAVKVSDGENTYEGQGVFKTMESYPNGTPAIRFEFATIPSASGLPSETLLDNFAVVNNGVLRIVASIPKSGAKSFSPDSELKVIFNTVVDSSSLDGVLKLNDIPLSPDEYSIDGAYLTIRPQGGFDENCEYELKIDNLQSANGSVFSEKISFKTSGYYYTSPISFNQNSIGAEVKVTTQRFCDDEKQGYLTVNVFDQNKNLLMFKCIEVSWNRERTDFTVSLEDFIESMHYAECFLWDDFSSLNTVVPSVFAGTNPTDIKQSDKEYEYRFNADTSLFEIFGKNNGSNVLVALLRENTSPDDKLCADDIVYVSQAVPNNNGYWYISAAPDTDSGKLGILIISDDGKIWLPNELNYTSKAYVKTLTDMINSENSDYSSVIDNGFEIIGIYKKDYSSNNALRNSVNQKLSEHKPYAGLKAFAAKFNEIMFPAVLNISESSDEVFDSIENYNADDIISAFDAYETYIGISQSGKADLWTSVAKRNDYTDIGDIRKEFNEQTILKAVKYALNQSHIKNILNDNCALINLDLTTYNSLGDKNAVNSMLMGKSFLSTDELKNTFSQIMYDIKNPQSNNSHSNSSSSGSGGMGGYSKTDIPQNNNTLPGNGDNSSGGTNTPISPYKDMDKYHWAFDAVEYLTSQRIISGSGDGRFEPDRAITREEFVKMLVSALASNDAQTQHHFSDVDPQSWYAPYVYKANELGIVHGISESKFGTGTNITRQDMAVMCYRAMVYAGKNLSYDKKSFADSDSIADYAIEAVEVMAYTGIINGMGDNMFCPYGIATRAQCARIIYDIFCN